MNPNAIKLRDFWSMAEGAAQNPLEETGRKVLADLLDEHDSPVRAHVFRHGVLQQSGDNRGADVWDEGSNLPRFQRNAVVLPGEKVPRFLRGSFASMRQADHPLEHRDLNPAERIELFHAEHPITGDRKQVLRYTLHLPSGRHLRLLAEAHPEHLEALGWGAYVPKATSRKLSRKAGDPEDKEYNAMVKAAVTARDGLGPHDMTPALVLADMMEEKGRVGAHLLREGARHGMPLYQTPYEDPDDDDESPTPTDDPLVFATAPGVHAHVERDPDGKPFFSVLHHPDQKEMFVFNGPRSLFYHVPIHSLAHMHHMLQDFPGAMRTNAITQLKKRFPLTPLRSTHDSPQQLARMRAPAGGAVDGQSLYQRGGQFMSAAFRRIRDVASRLIKLERPEINLGERWGYYGDEDKTQVLLHRLTPTQLPHEKGTDTWRWMHTPGNAADHVRTVPAEHLQPGGEWEHAVDMYKTPLMGIPLSLREKQAAGLVDPPAPDYMNAHDVPPEMFQMARDKSQTGELPGSAFHGSDPSRPLTIRELKQMEDDHGLTPRQRLSPKVLPDAKGDGDDRTFRATKKHVAKFLNHLTNARLKGHALRKALTDPRRSDEQKVAYAALHMSHEAREFLDATQAGGAGEWYGEHVTDFERAIHHTFGEGFEPGSARQTLVKAAVALSSSGTNPKTNALTAYRMIREGIKRRPDHPFLGIPAYNEAALREWAKKAGVEPPAPGHTDVDELTPPSAEHAWFVKHVLPRADLHDPGYQSRPAVIVDRPGHPDHGKLVEYAHEGKDVLTPEGGTLYQRHRGKKALRTVYLPITDEHGRLKPKGWNAQGAQVESGMERLQKLVRVFGEEGARNWLLTPQPDAAFERLFGYKPDRSQIGTNEMLPGAFVLGPKFGAFLLNLHGNTPEGEHNAKWLTADKWWSRSWNRFMGTLLAGAKRGGHVESPRGRVERAMMTRAARDAYKTAGLRNVAELQAVLWYYEQSLWRMLGVKQAKSYSFRDGAKAILKAHAAHEEEQISFPFGYNDPHYIAQNKDKIPE